MRPYGVRPAVGSLAPLERVRGEPEFERRAHQRRLIGVAGIAARHRAVAGIHHVLSIRSLDAPRAVLIRFRRVCIFARRAQPPRLSMTLARSATQFVAGIALATAVFAPAPASARTPYDGNWSVLIVTRSGPCDHAYRYGLSIRDGAVFYEGSASVNVAGRVNGRRRRRVSASRPARRARAASGRLGTLTGSGQWRGIGSMGTCVGDMDRRAALTRLIFQA